MAAGSKICAVLKKDYQALQRMTLPSSFSLGGISSLPAENHQNIKY